MRRLAVAVPAKSLFAPLVEVWIQCLHSRVVQQMLVTADTIAVHYLLTCFQNLYHLWFIAQGEDCSVPEPVFGLEEVLVEYVIVRHMAVIAVGYSFVRAVLPCGILWCHDMAVHAGLRLVAQVRVGLRNIECEKEYANPDSKQQGDRYPPCGGWSYFPKQISHNNRIKSTAIPKYEQNYQIEGFNPNFIELLKR